MTNQILISTIELRGGGGRLVNKSHFCKPTIKRKISRARQSFWTGNKEFCRAIMLISWSLKLLLQKIIVLWGILWCTKSVICLVRSADSGCVCVSWSVYLFEETDQNYGTRTKPVFLLRYCFWFVAKQKR